MNDLKSDLQSTMISRTHTVLRSLIDEPYPPLESPPDVKKRASVALIIRISPSYDYWPAQDAPNPKNLDDFLSQEWVQHGSPEVLFIKRASRKGDRWTSHIALPGGRRDPEDVDDGAAAVRETWEEVGLDLQTYGMPVGSLPQRLVTTHWGKKPLMVLCPYIYLLTTHATPPLRLQPTEVASTHWVPISSLLSPSNRTVAFEDVSSRLAHSETGVTKWMLSLILGKMLFAAINLTPSESLHSSQSPGVLENRYTQSSRSSRLERYFGAAVRGDWFHQYPDPPRETPLTLWGLTLGVVSDFLDAFPPHTALEMWTYPTFTPLDVRFAVWLLTWRFKARKRAELQAGTMGKVDDGATSQKSSQHSREQASYGGSSESVVLVHRPGEGANRPDETGLHGLGTGSPDSNRRSAVSTMLEGFVFESLRFEALLPRITDRARYYDIVRSAVGVALVGRASLLVVLVVVGWKRWRARRG